MDVIFRFAAFTMQIAPWLDEPLTFTIQISTVWLLPVTPHQALLRVQNSRRQKGELIE